MVHEWSANKIFSFLQKFIDELTKLFIKRFRRRNFRCLLHRQVKNQCHGKSPDSRSIEEKSSRFDSVLELEQRTIDTFYRSLLALNCAPTGDRWFHNLTSRIGSNVLVVVAFLLQKKTRKTLWQAWEKGNMRIKKEIKNWTIS